MRHVEHAPLDLLDDVAVLANERRHCDLPDVRQLLLREAKAGVRRLVPAGGGGRQAGLGGRGGGHEYSFMYM